METVNLIMPSTNMVALDNNWKNEAEEAILISEKQEKQQPKRSPFIEANTNEVTLEHLKNDCIIPTFSKDNEVCISHQCFIESIYEQFGIFIREKR